jgi:hypothetical protein
MAAKTLKQFYIDYLSGSNIITGKPNLYKDLTDGMVWDAAIKSMEEIISSYNNIINTMQLFDSIDLDHDMDYVVARIARIAIKQYRTAKNKS